MKKFFSISLVIVILASCTDNKGNAIGDKIVENVVEEESLQTALAVEDESEVFSFQEGKDYEIMLKEIQGTVTNYYIKNITSKLNEPDLYDFAKAIQKQVGGKCNIYIYSSDSVKDLMTKYPLQGEEYLKVADAFVYLLAFDGAYSFYPFQDIQYKEFGGKNWKKEPLK